MVLLILDTPTVHLPDGSSWQVFLGLLGEKQTSNRAMDLLLSLAVGIFLRCVFRPCAVSDDLALPGVVTEPASTHSMYPLLHDSMDLK